MSQTAESAPYKCRPKVLMSFFLKSRDKWKRKCIEAKSQLKKANNLAHWLYTSRDEWKDRAKRLEAELQRLRGEEKKTIR